MKLWQCTYNLKCKLTDKIYINKDSWWSIKCPKDYTVQNYWDAIYPNNYIVSDCKWELITQKDNI